MSLPIYSLLGFYKQHVSSEVATLLTHQEFHFAEPVALRQGAAFIENLVAGFQASPEYTVFISGVKRCFAITFF